MSDIIVIVAVLLVIKIVLDIRDRRKAYREINNRFDRLHNQLSAMDERLERKLGSQDRTLVRMGDRLERIDCRVGAPYREDD